MENASNKSKIMEVEEEMNKLSGQQNLQQRIHHHAKIKVTSFCASSIIFSGTRVNIVTVFN
jgi:hypothetical protein